jgi:hypothetical protein
MKVPVGGEVSLGRACVSLQCNKNERSCYFFGILGFAATPDIGVCLCRDKIQTVGNL